MKKTLFTLALVIISGMVFFSGCQKEELYEEGQPGYEDQGFYKDELIYCGDQTTAPLTDFAQTITVGSITIGNDAENLYITFEPDAGWSFANNYIHADPFDDIPVHETYLTFMYWQFEYKDWVAKTMFTKTIPKSEILMDEQDDCFAVSVYTLAVNENPDLDPVEAWATLTYTETPFGYHVEYCWQECPAPDPLGGPKLAFAYNEEYSTCFRDIKRSNGKYNPQGNGNWSNFMLWGWRSSKFTEAGTYNFDLVAGAGSCDAAAGTVVGEVTLVYDGSTATVSYEVDPAFTLISTYAYAGKKRLPKKWNKFTVIPWFYPKKHQQINTVTDTYTFNNKNNGVRLVACAVVKDAEE